MGIKLSKTLLNGVEVSYWKIARVILKGNSGSGEVLLESYVSKEAKDKGSAPVGEGNRIFTIEGAFSVTAMNKSSNNPIKIAYTKILEQPDFVDGVEI